MLHSIEFVMLTMIGSIIPYVMNITSFLAIHLNVSIVRTFISLSLVYGVTFCKIKLTNSTSTDAPLLFFSFHIQHILFPFNL